MTAQTEDTVRQAAAATVPRPARALVLEGVRDVTPMVLGVVPFALAIGAAIGTSSVPSAAGVVSGPAILAGSAQLTTVQMLDAGVAPVVIIASALMINARILLYSASLAPWFRDEPLGRRLVLAAPVIDQLHFTCIPRFERGDLDQRGRRLYYTGAASWLAGAWLMAQGLAVAVGARLPEAAGLRVAAPLAMAGLLARTLPDRRSVTAAASAAVLAVVGAGLPLHSTVLVAAVGGMLAGSFAPADRGRS